MHDVKDAPINESQRAALLLIHGIGEQNPYETLDAFAIGLAERFGIAAEEMEHVLEWSAEDDTSSCLRMHLRKETGRSGARVLDLHEFYWAGLVQGRISLRQVLVWLARTSLVPLLWWSKQPAILFREKNEIRDKRNPKRYMPF